VLKKIGWTCCFGKGGARARVGHKPDLHGTGSSANIGTLKPLITYIFDPLLFQLSPSRAQPIFVMFYTSAGLLNSECER
jgi:hypothetical protein